MAQPQTHQTRLLASRRLADIDELVSKPYPGIELRVQDANVAELCLVLSPPEQKPLHLKIHLGPDYPLSPPTVSIQSSVEHPNIFGSYICASILNDGEAYTPAYTLKGIAIQLLSFFASDSIEQDYGAVINRSDYSKHSQHRFLVDPTAYVCQDCGFGKDNSGAAMSMNAISNALPSAGAIVAAPHTCPIAELSDDMLLEICEKLETEDLLRAASAWEPFRRMLHTITPTRNLRCFTLKKGFKEANLGIGVHAERGSLQSEFDLLSSSAFTKLRVRRSIHGLYFEQWLPLPLSQAHWHRVRGSLLNDSLDNIRRSMTQSSPITRVQVLYTFMNDVVVRLSRAASEGPAEVTRSRVEQKSTLLHASEKAVESYLSLFHLLVCMAHDDPTIVTAARGQLDRFLGGQVDKSAVPNVGHLLISRLLTDIDSGGNAENAEEVTIAIVKEAVTRNVVWMLDAKGAGMAELSYIEPSATSDYRLRKTFDASRTSYQLLMFLNLMRRFVLGTHTKGALTLDSMQQTLFRTHGVPGPGVAAGIAQSIRQIQKVDNFVDFLKAMDVKVLPKKSEFVNFLKKTVTESMERGYSKWALTQERALGLRLIVEPAVERVEGMEPMSFFGQNPSFFPGQAHGRQTGGQRGGRGMGMGMGMGRGRGRR
ncbi:hypothetical protein BLS_003257 [Venturia inaequalis]|uniref:UBC core domain-containing protein n=1 Tax=Venturia inaequalis TaxID=5025 RepID=A0A8H3UP47_VENIN|nr:hypothetical protein BLS_003257 [Venturia inaequalis]